MSYESLYQQSWFWIQRKEKGFHKRKAPALQKLKINWKGRMRTQVSTESSNFSNSVYSEVLISPFTRRINSLSGEGQGPRKAAGSHISSTVIPRVQAKKIDRGRLSQKMAKTVTINMHLHDNRCFRDSLPLEKLIMLRLYCMIRIIAHRSFFLNCTIH